MLCDGDCVGECRGNMRLDGDGYICIVNLRVNLRSKFSRVGGLQRHALVLVIKARQDEMRGEWQQLGKDGTMILAFFERDDKDKTLVGIESLQRAAERVHLLGIVCAINDEPRAVPCAPIHAPWQGDVREGMAQGALIERASQARRFPPGVCLPMTSVRRAAAHRSAR